ncbi:uncharacterized protein LOC132704916 [Cylas formicarius]|uniref:uncharacterized protein LOC132704916 n=1 Tax=Cylas formicarius TaxID=197179 RepID=UPI00295871B6|nr:uncharacterized protein LOC132704916 [Cylas formicarius]
MFFLWFLLSLLALCKSCYGLDHFPFHLQHAETRLYIGKDAVSLVQSKDKAGIFTHGTGLNSLDTGKSVAVKGGCKGSNTELTLADPEYRPFQKFSYENGIIESKCGKNKVVVPDKNNKTVILETKDSAKLKRYKFDYIIFSR